MSAPPLALLDADLAGHAPGEGLAAAVSAGLDRLGGRVVLFRWREWVFVSFGLFGAVGALLTTGLMAILLVGQGVAPSHFAALALAGGAAVVAGSWLLGLVFDWRQLLASPSAVLRRPVFVSWGGVMGLTLTLAVFARHSGLSALALLDALACSIFLGHAVGRVGCLAYGCCFGRPTRCRLSITYRSPLAKAVRVGHLHGVPLHPAALYEAVAELALLAVINAVAASGAPLGLPTALGLLGYGSIRFFVEFLRDQEGRAVLGPLSLNHLIALGLVALGAGLAAHALPGTPGAAAPAITWSASLAAAPWLAPSTLPVALLVFAGFSAHRGGVGRW